MIILMSDTYMYDRSTDKTDHVVTGLIGAFETEEKAIEVWNEQLKEMGVPEELFIDSIEDGFYGQRSYTVDMDGQYTDDIDNVEFIIYIMSKKTELNKVLTNEYRESRV